MKIDTQMHKIGTSCAVSIAVERFRNEIFLSVETFGMRKI